MDYNSFKIHEFKLDQMVNNPQILMIAKRGAGKSYVCRDIMHHYRHLPGGLVISPTDRMNPFYKDFFPDLYVHHECSSALLKKLLRRQTLAIKKSKVDKTDPSGLLIMDDCLARIKSWAKDESTTEILMNARHYKLPYILTVQTPLGLTPDLRLNFDYVFLFKDDSTINRKKIWDNYASIFPTFSAFEKVFEKCTRDNKVMVIDNRKPVDNISQKVFWFKAQDRKFTFGSKQFVDIHKKYYNPDYLTNSSGNIPDTDKNKPIDNSGTDYLFNYFINENKFNQQLKPEWDAYIAGLNTSDNKPINCLSADEENTSDNCLICEQSENGDLSSVDSPISIRPNTDDLFDYMVNVDKLDDSIQKNDNTKQTDKSRKQYMIDKKIELANIRGQNIRAELELVKKKIELESMRPNRKKQVKNI